MSFDHEASGGSRSGPTDGSPASDPEGAPTPDRQQLAEILEAVSFAASRLLVTEAWEEVVDDVLARLGRATDVSRLYVFENHRSEQGQLLASLRHEWTRPGVDAQMDNPELQDVPYEGTGFDRWREELAERRIVSGDVATFPEEERDFLRAQEITSLAVVPVFAGEAWWGFMGYDETRGPRAWSPTLLRALHTAADTYGTAVRRRQMKEELEASRAELERLALQDPLTGLPNRSLLEDRLGQSLERARRMEGRVAVVFLDLDRLKVVNDTLGHGAGDQLLASVADRLGETVRKHDTIARFGGDQFVGVIEAVEDEGQARVAVERLASAFGEPFRLMGTEIHASASIGVALSSEELREGTDLLRCAHMALNRSKGAEGTGYHVFDPAEDEVGTTRLHRENEIRAGLDEDRFVVHFQPVVEIASGRIVGAEALARWDHPREGLLSPATFLPIAEETGLVERLDDVVAGAASTRMAGWRGSPGRDDLVLSVNMSPHGLRRPDVVERVSGTLDRSGLPPNALEIEITERTAMRGVEQLSRLREMGVRLAIDDFGTGYSSLEYLTHLDITTLKIDRSFVSGLERDRRDTAVVESIVLLARRLELDVVAEGVELEEQWRWLRDIACPHGQGYYFAPPVPPAEFEGLLAEGGLPAGG